VPFSSLLRISKQEEGQFGDKAGSRGPRFWFPAPFFLNSTTSAEGGKMILYRNPAPLGQVTKLLQEASARTGFTVSDIEALVASELDTSHLLDYISAVMSNRMN